MKGIQVVVPREKMSLYADETLLYLANAGVSLQSALEIIDRFGGYSGIHTNSDKFFFFSLHLPGSGIDTGTPLQWEEEFKYLG